MTWDSTPARRGSSARSLGPPSLSLFLLLFPAASPATGAGGTSRDRAGPSSRAAVLVAQQAPPKPAPAARAKPAASRTEEWRRATRALEPRRVKSGQGWQLLAPPQDGAAAGVSDEGLRRTRSEVLLLLLAIQREEGMARLRASGADGGTIARLERGYDTGRACLERRLGADLPAVLDEARRNRSVLEALGYRLAGFPPVREGGLPR